MRHNLSVAWVNKPDTEIAFGFWDYIYIIPKSKCYFSIIWILGLYLYNPKIQMLFQYQAWHCPSLCPHSVNAVGSFEELYHAGLRAENSYVADLHRRKSFVPVYTAHKVLLYTAMGTLGGILSHKFITLQPDYSAFKLALKQ